MIVGASKCSFRWVDGGASDQESTLKQSRAMQSATSSAQSSHQIPPGREGFTAAATRAGHKTLTWEGHDAAITNLPPTLCNALLSIPKLHLFRTFAGSRQIGPPDSRAPGPTCPLDSVQCLTVRGLNARLSAVRGPICLEPICTKRSHHKAVESGQALFPPAYTDALSLNWFQFQEISQASGMDFPIPPLSWSNPNVDHLSRCSVWYCAAGLQLSWEDGRTVATLDVRHLVPRASPQPGGNLRFAAFHLQMFNSDLLWKAFYIKCSKVKTFHPRVEGYFVLVSFAGRWYFWNELDQIKVGWVGGS